MYIKVNKILKLIWKIYLVSFKSLKIIFTNYLKLAQLIVTKHKKTQIKGSNRYNFNHIKYLLFQIQIKKWKIIKHQWVIRKNNNIKIKIQHKKKISRVYK